VKDWAMIDITGTGGLDSIRTLISQNAPLAYGTRLYTDFPHYNGTPSPYVGNGHPLHNRKTNKMAGHCMLIIGYDDSMGENGALLIQNSFGPEWGCQWNGNGGYIWMDCVTFQKLAQGKAFHITSIAL
jgi:C1A family cysteine protease